MTVLSGWLIADAVKKGTLEISPFNPENVQPNSYDCTLAQTIGVYAVKGAGHLGERYLDHDGNAHDLPDFLDSAQPNTLEEYDIHEEKGAVLIPGLLYLGSTVESIYSDKYAAKVSGRSSVGRLGVSVHQTAGMVDVGFRGNITLEITVIHPTKIYAGMRICQLEFYEVADPHTLYQGKYQGAHGLEPSKLFKDFK